MSGRTKPHDASFLAVFVYVFVAPTFCFCHPVKDEYRTPENEYLTVESATRPT